MKKVIKMSKVFISALIALAVVGSAVIILRFGVGGAEDNWICSGGEWVKHGNPQAPMPQEPCGPVKTPSPTLPPESVLPPPPKNLPVEMDFFRNGELVRNRPDLETKGLYLVYSRLGKAPVTVLLSFDQASNCQLNGEVKPCFDLGTEDVMTGRVEGYQMDPKTVLVRNLTSPLPK